MKKWRGVITTVSVFVVGSVISLIFLLRNAPTADLFITGTATQGSFTLTSCRPLAGLIAGMRIVGPGVESGTKVVSFNDTAHTITLNRPATESYTAATYNVSTLLPPETPSGSSSETLLAPSKASTGKKDTTPTYTYPVVRADFPGTLEINQANGYTILCAPGKEWSNWIHIDEHAAGEIRPGTKGDTCYIRFSERTTTNDC